MAASKPLVSAKAKPQPGKAMGMVDLRKSIPKLVPVKAGTDLEADTI